MTCSAAIANSGQLTMQRSEEEHPAKARRAAVLTQADKYMSVEQLGQGQAKWQHFAVY